MRVRLLSGLGVSPRSLPIIKNTSDGETHMKIAFDDSQWTPGVYQLEVRSKVDGASATIDYTKANSIPNIKVDLERSRLSRANQVTGRIVLQATLDKWDGAPDGVTIVRAPEGAPKLPVGAAFESLEGAANTRLLNFPHHRSAGSIWQLLRSVLSLWRIRSRISSLGAHLQ